MLIFLLSLNLCVINRWGFEIWFIYLIHKLRERRSFSLAITLLRGSWSSWSWLWLIYWCITRLLLRMSIINWFFQKFCQTSWLLLWWLILFDWSWRSYFNRCWWSLIWSWSWWLIRSRLYNWNFYWSCFLPLKFMMVFWCKVFTASLEQVVSHYHWACIILLDMIYEVSICLESMINHLGVVYRNLGNVSLNVSGSLFEHGFRTF